MVGKPPNAKGNWTGRPRGIRIVDAKEGTDQEIAGIRERIDLGYL